MTGFGAARGNLANYEVSVELKSVNGRFLKIHSKLPPNMASRELEAEGLLKSRLRRGSVTLSLRARCTDPEGLVTINDDVVRAYQSHFRRLGLSEERIPQLPGVLNQEREEAPDDSLWQAMAEIIAEALGELVRMREREGGALKTMIEQLCAAIETLRLQVKSRSTVVVTEYQAKLQQRLEVLLADSQISLDSQQVAREVAILADRSDVTEEIERLGAHLTQISQLLNKGGEMGRQLDFLAQEMLREANTIGSKSADAEISRYVIDLKTEIERVKEQVANIE
ncbi:MAG: YicC/YloC family endoribonuclease [Myxococcota bacterium]